jgi:hypothetical protein
MNLHLSLGQVTMASLAVDGALAVATVVSAPISSGTVYLGSKQGYPEKGDTQEYPGCYVMTYDPKAGKAECLGMPSKGYGVGDVVADEGRGLLYVVVERAKPTVPMGWMRYDPRKKKYRAPGPRPTPYAMTLIDGKGRTQVVEGEFRVATYDPAADKVTTDRSP